MNKELSKLLNLHKQLNSALSQFKNSPEVVKVRDVLKTLEAQRGALLEEIRGLLISNELRRFKRKLEKSQKSLREQFLLGITEEEDNGKK